MQVWNFQKLIIFIIYLLRLHTPMNEAFEVYIWSKWTDNLILSGYAVTPVAFDSGASTQGSKLTVSNPTTDKIYTCKVEHNSEEVAVKNVNLNVYGKRSQGFNLSISPRTLAHC